MAGLSWIDRIWYQEHPLSVLLRPLAWLFGVIAAARRGAYRLGLLRQQKMTVPVIVVGNISVGGVGKTPLVIDLVQRLQAAGWRPGVVSRGYGGSVKVATRVGEQSDPSLVGDEPVMIAQKTRCPVVVAVARTQAARLLSVQGVNIIVADDGLQHYALARDFEIAVVDGQRLHGNGQLLPAGPLRELPSRLDQVNLVLMTRADSDQVSSEDEYVVESSTGEALHLNTGCKQTLRQFAAGEGKVHAVAGIGHPEKFFSILEQAGLQVVRHPFPDHHRYQPQDLKFSDNLPIIMTEKDAVKCQRFRDARVWALEYQARLPEAAWQRILDRFPTPQIRK